MRPEPPSTLRFIGILAKAALLRRSHHSRALFAKGLEYHSILKRIDESYVTLVALVALFAALLVPMQLVYTIRVTQQAREYYKAGDSPGSMPVMPEGRGGDAVVLAAGLMLTVMFVPQMLTFLLVAEQQLGRVEWDLEWLFTFPVSAESIFAAKTVECAGTSFLPIVSYTSFFPLILWVAGYRFAAFPLGLISVAYTVLMMAAIKVACEARLRPTQPLSRLLTLQAVLGGASVYLVGGVYLLAMAVGLPLPIIPLSRVLYPLLLLVPWSAPIVLCKGGMAAVLALCAMGFWAVVMWKVTSRVFALSAEGGLSSQTVAYQGRRGAKAVRRTRAGGFVSGLLAKAMPGGIAGKEIRLLWRDKNLLGQLVVLPLLALAGYYVSMRFFLKAYVEVFSNLGFVAGYFVATYVASFGAMRALSGEGKALWLLYGFPEPLHRMVLKKAVFWGATGAFFVVGFTVAGFEASAPAGASTFVDTMFALCSVFMAAIGMSALGAMNTDPTRTEPSLGVPGGMTVFVQLFLLGAFYSYGALAAMVWAKSVHLLVCGAVTYAMWRRMKAKLPLVLDRG